jgi:hypothetical protein
MSLFVALVEIVAETAFEASIHAGLELMTRPRERPQDGKLTERDRSYWEEQERLDRLRKGITDSNF